MLYGTAQVSHQVFQFCVPTCACEIVVSAGKLRRTCDYLSELRSSLFESLPEREVLRTALLPVKNAHFTLFFRQV